MEINSYKKITQKGVRRMVNVYSCQIKRNITFKIPFCSFSLSITTWIYYKVSWGRKKNFFLCFTSLCYDLGRLHVNYSPNPNWERPKAFYQFSSVTQLCPTLCDSMDCSTPGLPIHHQFPEFTQTHVHWVGNAIQPSHPLLSPSLLP